MKKILKSDAVKSIIGWVAASYIWLVYRTSRWQVINGELPNQMVREKKPFIMTFWHGRLLMMPLSMGNGAKAHVLISQHGDGEIIARTVKHWGIDSIRGSSSKGALPAIKNILQVIKKNEIAVITPDGPRGPRMRAQEGVVRIAAMSGVPVFASGYSTTRGKRLSSWDRFMVAKPFSRGVTIWSDPIYVPRSGADGAHEKALLEIENKLNEVTQEADRLCGHEPVEPAPLPEAAVASEG